MPRDKLRSKAPLLLSYPCPVKWESMEGDNSIRSCENCACKVQNITDYSEAQVNELLVRVDAGEQICVAFSVPKIITGSDAQLNAPAIGPRYGDWPDSVNGSMDSSFSLRASLISPQVKRFSIALAASVSLAYCAPTARLAAYAQASTGGDPNIPVISVAPNSTGPVQPAFRKMTDGVLLGAQEHEIWDGRPAPSAIRDFVNYIILYRGPKGSAETQRLLESFKQEVHQGRISVPRLEDLARAYELYGPKEQASSCYSLLSALADQGHARKETTQDWFPRRKPKEITEEISAFDQAFAGGEYIRALWHLAAANGLRKLDPALRNNLPWPDIARRVDLLQSKFGCSDDPAFLTQALSLAGDETETPELQLWLESKRSLAAQLFDQNVTKSDKAIAKGHYREALELLDCAVWAGSIDPEIVKRCHWSSASKRLTKLVPHLDDSSRGECLALAQQATSDDKLQAEPRAHQFDYLETPSPKIDGLQSGRSNSDLRRHGTIKMSPMLPEGAPVPSNE